MLLPRPLRAIDRRGLRISQELVHSLLSSAASVHPAPVFVLGNQKAGTSAIAALLARTAGLRPTMDFQSQNTRPAYEQADADGSDFERFIERNRLEFSRGIIKEPNLTFLYRRLAERFPRSRFIFVSRDPRDNIRSILDRLGLPGDLVRLGEERRAQVPAAWRLALEGGWPVPPCENYVGTLARRWDLAAGIFLKHRGKMILVHYEDFLKDKAGCIAGLAGRLGLEQVHDISDMVNVPFQPPGNRGVRWPEFFGPENLGRIERICVARMAALDYPPGAEGPAEV